MTLWRLHYSAPAAEVPLMTRRKRVWLLLACAAVLTILFATVIVPTWIAPLTPQEMQLVGTWIYPSPAGFPPNYNTYYPDRSFSNSKTGEPCPGIVWRIEGDLLVLEHKSKEINTPWGRLGLPMPGARMEVSRSRVRVSPDSNMAFIGSGAVGDPEVHLNRVNRIETSSPADVAPVRQD